MNEQESIDCIVYAFKNEITSFDTAPPYNNAELYLGKALKHWKGERPFISSKEATKVVIGTRKISQI